MQRNRLQPALSKLHQGLRVIRYSNRGEHIYHGGNDVVYYYNKLVGVVPIGNIYLHGTELYHGSKYRNRSLRGLTKIMGQRGIIRPDKIREAYEEYRSI